jgi:hypothetical protein
LKDIAAALKDNRKDLMVVVLIQSIVAIGCYFAIPALF